MPRDISITIRMAKPKVKPSFHTIYLQIDGKNYFIAAHTKKNVADKLALLSRTYSGRDYFVS